MHVAIAADHAGFELKQLLAERLSEKGHEVEDLGTDSLESVDYPDFAEAVGVAVAERRVERGIVICGSGVGASIAANKIPGVRAGLCHDTYSAHQGVEHDDMNVLVLGSRIIGIALAEELVDTFLAATFEDDPRFTRRLRKVLALETRFAGRQEE